MANVFDQFDGTTGSTTSTPDTTGMSGDPASFKAKYGAAAEKAGKALGIDPDLILGQWGEETRWGKSIIPGTNNLGNIKSKTGVAAKDNQTGSTDSYAKFESPDAFADHYVDLVKTKYPNAVDAGNDVKKFTTGLKGYAEDNQYATKVAASAATVAGVPGSKTTNPFDQFDGVTDTPAAAAPADDYQEPTQLQSDVRGVGLGTRAVAAGAASPITGIGDLLNTGINAGIRGVNALASTNIPQLALPSQVTQNALTAAGLPQPATPTERVLSDVQGGVASTLTGAGLAGQASKVVANPIAQNALAQLSQQPVQQAAAAATGAGAAGTARESGASPLGQFIIGLTGGMAPLSVANLLQSSDRATVNAARLLQKAVQANSPEDWNKARELLTESQRQGIPLLGPEALAGSQQLHTLTSDVAAAPASGNKIQNALAERPQQVEDAARNNLAKIGGTNTGTQEAANAAQEAADKVIRDAQEYRTEAAGPHYQGQRASDTEALDLTDTVKSLPSKIVALSDSRNSAVQVAGKLHQFANEQINLMNKAIRKGAYKDEEGNTQTTWTQRTKAERHDMRADEGKSGTYEAVNRANQFRAQLDASQRDLENAADRLAQKNLPQIQTKVSGLLSKIDSQIRLAGDTPEGKILQQYRDELAPGGRPIVLPSQLESIYKANRDKTMLGLNPTPEQRTQAGVIGSHISDLDNLIKDVSPAIRNGRQIYEQISKEVIDPMMKGPIGKLAGRGADAQKEAVASRVASELQGKNATPERIATIADAFNKSDKTTFPNVVRSYLEDKLNSALKPSRGETLTTRGTTLRDALEPNPKEAANLRTMIQKSAEAQGADPTKVYQGFGRFLDVLDATGRLGAPKAARVGDVGEEAAKNAANAAVDAVSVGAKKTILNAITDFTRRGAYGKLASVMTSDFSVREMQDLANLDTKSPGALQIVANIISGKKPAQAAAAALRSANQAAQPQPAEGQ
jgi:flagellum-specific peptidoglycan hydrolase FlgJ